MKSLKIGNLIFNSKAVSLIAVCLFLNGIAIGTSVASSQAGVSISVIPLFVMLFAPYILFFKSIKNNVSEV
ncbi:hypothetical protein [Tenacibaculum sp. M341]|uniref:hypothetical protein n=1 Tax=Tenacibaculum sp. M341 TaxID=2530339 RepID=UPI00104D4F35|nr:hypothetical protein [Tenacibaculum sp. M341]TCI85337.1 hypothetical protein EYW44_17340 [Tenacibaculum sp. M341]